MKSLTKWGVGLTLAIVAVAAAASMIDPHAGALIYAFLTDPHAQAGVLMAEAAVAIDPEVIKAELKKIGDSLKEVGQQALAEAKKSGDMSKEVKDRVDGMLVTQGELQASLLDVQQKLARRGEPETTGTRSAGDLLISAEDFKKWLAAGGMKSTQSGFVMPVPRSALVTTDAAGSPGSVGVPPDNRPGVFQIANRRLTVRDLITPGRTSSNLVQYTKETGFTNNAAPVTETAQKPESTITYELTQSPVVTIAHFIKASKQILDDFLGLQSNIDGRLRYGLKLVEEGQLLKGSGTGNNLNGIYTQATAYSAPIAVASPTKIDTLRLMLLQAELAEYPSTGIVLHPSDWAAIELTKETTGGYIFANPQSLAMPSLWGRPVVPTQAMTVDTALVGAFTLGAQVFDREDANVVIATENQDDFIKNMITIRAEERLALAVYRPEAFIKNTDLPST